MAPLGMAGGVTKLCSSCTGALGIKGPRPSTWTPLLCGVGAVGSGSRSLALKEGGQMPPGVKEGMGFPDFFGILPVLVQVQAQGVVCAVAAVLRDAERWRCLGAAS